MADLLNVSQVLIQAEYQEESQQNVLQVVAQVEYQEASAINVSQIIAQVEYLEPPPEQRVSQIIVQVEYQENTTSLDEKARYTQYFLNSKSSVVQLELLEISHSAFTKTYYVVRNSTNGITVTLETGVVKTFDFYPLAIEPISETDNLDQSLKISLGDLGEVLPKEFDAIEASNSFSEKPIVKYRVYRSDDLSAPMIGPIVLEVKMFNFNREGSTFEAKAPSLNINKTGEVYNLDRFPMLRGFL